MTSLDEFRAGIDRLDDQIVELLRQRFALVESIGAEKARTGQAVRVPTREESILARLTAGLSSVQAESIRSVYRAIFAASCAREKGSPRA